MSPIFFYFFVSFVTVIYTPIRIYRYSCYIVLDTEMQAFSLKHPLLHLFRSLHGRGCPQFFWDFFVSFRFSDLYTHQNPWLLLLHSARHRDAGLTLKLPLLHLFRSLHGKRCLQFFRDFFVSFRYSDLHTYQRLLRLSLLLLHSAGH